MQIKTFHSFCSDHQRLYEEIFTLTQSNAAIYSGYEKWYRGTFLAGLAKNERIVIIAQDESNNCLAGCALLKNTPQEKKLCTLFVHPHYRRQGLAKRLIQQTLQELGKLPLTTVSGRNFSQLAALFQQCGFHLSAAKKGVYHSQDTEYYFNDAKADAIKDGLIPVLQKRMQQLKGK